MLAVEENVSLKNYNTFGIDVRARYLAHICSTKDLVQLLHTEPYRSLPRLILGGGSNILFTGDFDGIIIKNELAGLQAEPHNAHQVMIRVASGENWHQLVAWCVSKGYGGIENLSLIPGTVGAAPMQNIGAYGVELSETLHTVEAMELATGKLRVFTKEECELGYRESIFKHKLKDKYFITAVNLLLTDTNRTSHYECRTHYGDIRKYLDSKGVKTPTIADVSHAVIAIRKSKLPDPKELGNAGSFFKNPVIDEAHFKKILSDYPEVPHYQQSDGTYKIPAAWLIEQCGWKGKRIGNTGSHARQALVLVNYGGATGTEIFLLAEQIRSTVQERFNILLQPEVNIY
ncbi:MAG: UDP-N-acetylmuramate dehydrogenase [Chitinophagales bacterium]|nr:UDP-N-acetylmuramate dehydrogenase [Chitinophagales bacterium]